MTSFKNQPKVCNMIHSLVRVSINIIKVGFDYVLDIIKREIHGSLEGCSGVFKAERHFSICKSTPRTYKCHLVLVLRFDLDLVIPWKSIHKIKGFDSRTLIENIVNERSQEVIFRTIFVQVSKIHTYMDGSLFFIHRNGVRHPSSQGNSLDETNIK